jgi:hypothetical protein
MARGLRTRLVAAGLAAIIGGMMAPRAATGAAADAPPLPIAVLLTVSPALPAIARGTLVDEAERIWSREQVELQWLRPAGGTERPDAALRVLVISRSASAPPDTRRWPVAELLPQAGERPLAIASIDGAQRVIDEVQRHALLDLPGFVEYRLGLVLGRAIAHEIGHFLLATPGHADEGLMRASVDAREFAAVGADSFHLDAHARRWIRATMAGRTAAPAVQPERFSYRRP